MFFYSATISWSATVQDKRRHEDNSFHFHFFIIFRESSHKTSIYSRYGDIICFPAFLQLAEVVLTTSAPKRWLWGQQSAPSLHFDLILILIRLFLRNCTGSDMVEGLSTFSASGKHFSEVSAQQRATFSWRCCPIGRFLATSVHVVCSAGSWEVVGFGEALGPAVFGRDFSTHEHLPPVSWEVVGV